MKITFIVPSLNLTGGLRVVSIYAKLLAENGHTVTVASPNRRSPSLKEKVKSLLRGNRLTKQSGFYASFFENAPFTLKVLDSNRPVESTDIPDADVVIATFWKTAEWVSEYPASKGEKIYFIQHHEVHPWLPVERVKATLKLPFKKIVVSQWIADILREEYGDPSAIVVANGVDEKQFFASTRHKQAIPSIGIMYSLRSYKGCDTAFEAFSRAKKTIPSLKLVAFGNEEPNPILPFPEDTEFYLQPAQKELKEIYSKCDAWLFASRSEGFGLPILEAMACRTPVIGTHCGAAPELINDNNGILIGVDDTTAMANAIIEIAKMPNERWSILSQAAFETSTKHRWSESFKTFETALTNMA